MAEIVVTGSTGYIGRNFLMRAAAMLPNARFVGLTRSIRKARGLGLHQVRFVEGNVEDRETMSSAFRDASAVVHLAAAVKPRKAAEFFQTNVLGTQNVIELSKKAGVTRFVFVSSCDVGLPIVTRYSESKRQAEEIVTQSGLDYLIIRPTAVYGGFGATAMTGLQALVKRAPLVPVIGGGKQKLQPLYVDDLTAIILQALTAQVRNAVYEVGGPEQFTHLELIRELARASGKRGPIFHIPIPVALLAWVLAPFPFSGSFGILRERILSLSQDKVVSNERVMRDFDLTLTCLSDGLAGAQRLGSRVTESA
ncbi:MAG: NAD-dependent epimerase/dehydratase family protein [Xanthobacteraceae bacterium]|nr:NAD-dependent epimerase/dehydratase family protein [Xanthobacteraceae bacterium]